MIFMNISTFIRCLIRRLRKGQAEERIHHFVFIAAPIETVYREIIAWVQSDWWPRKSALRVFQEAPSYLNAGIKFDVALRGFKAPRWHVEITKITQEKEIEFTFFADRFQGRGAVNLESRVNGTRVDYEIFYNLTGLKNTLAWTLCYERVYNKSIKHFLNSLLVYLQKREKKAKQQ